MTQQTPRTGRRADAAPAAEVFRQFAWNLAGTLAKTRPDDKPRAPVRRTPRRPATGAGR